MDEIENFEKICWARVMLDKIHDCAKNIVSNSQSYITCCSPVVEVLSATLISFLMKFSFHLVWYAFIFILFFECVGSDI